MQGSLVSSSNIFAFPLDRRRHLVNAVASALETAHGDEATQVWHDTAKNLLRQLSSQGVAAEEAKSQVRRLLREALREVVIRSARAGGMPERTDRPRGDYSL